jgi:hypothetical protein
VRKYITINGDPTVELDFSAMHIHLLYAFKGFNYADKQEDAYSLPHGAHTLPNPDDDRDFSKLVLLTAFNAQTPELAASGVFDQLRRDHKLGKYGVRDHKPIKVRLALLKEKHPQISDLIANSFGVKLQYYDSCIIEMVINHFTAKNIPVLTVHDSVICQTEHQEEVCNAMLQSFYQVADELLNIKIKPVPKYLHAIDALRRWVQSFSCDIEVARSWLNRVSSQRAGSDYGRELSYMNPNTLEVKPTFRENVCSNGCKHHLRQKAKLKYAPNIKLELQAQEESFTNVLVVR